MNFGSLWDQKMIPADYKRFPMISDSGSYDYLIAASDFDGDFRIFHTTIFLFAHLKFSTRLKKKIAYSISYIRTDPQSPTRQLG